MELLSKVAKFAIIIISFHFISSSKTKKIQTDHAHALAKPRAKLLEAFFRNYKIFINH